MAVCSDAPLIRPPLSPTDFDDLEMCTSLSLPQDYEADGGSWYGGSSRGESAHLQQLVEDLRSQLTRCHKVIRGLQMRVRSLSATSDYASSLERTPRKVLCPSYCPHLKKALFSLRSKFHAFYLSFRSTGPSRHHQLPVAWRTMKAGCLTPRGFVLHPNPAGNCKN